MNAAGLQFKSAEIGSAEIGRLSRSSRSYRARVRIEMPITVLGESLITLGTGSAVRLLPYTGIVHKANLRFDYLFAVLGVFHGLSFQVKVLGIDRLLVKDLVQLSAKILEPVVPLCPRAMIAQRLDVDHTSHVSRASPILLPAHDLTLVINNERTSAESVDGSGFLGE